MGVGIWGINRPVMWGFAIINFVWWIGIGHAGTLISAILLLMKQQWRTSINRFAEAMTLFAVACAGMFPLLHMGRPWVFYWMARIRTRWRSGRSSAAPWSGTSSRSRRTRRSRSCSGTWGLIPDLATLRDRAQNKLRPDGIYAAGALGWTGSARHWKRYQTAYLILAGTVDASGGLGAYDRVLRLHDRHHPWLALDNLPALLRRGGHLRGLRDGLDPDDPAPEPGTASRG